MHTRTKTRTHTHTDHGTHASFLAAAESNAFLRRPAPLMSGHRTAKLSLSIFRMLSSSARRGERLFIAFRQAPADGRTDGRTEGRKDVETNGLTDRWTNGRTGAALRMHGRPDLHHFKEHGRTSLDVFATIASTAWKRSREGRGGCKW